MGDSDSDSLHAAWGFHVHMDVDGDSLPAALAVQDAFLRFLERRAIPVRRSEVYRPGYGPHVKHQWEVRIEDRSHNLHWQLGCAATWISLNRHGLPVLIHALTHDESTLDLHTEGVDHEQHAGWMGSHAQPLNLDFFFSPRIDAATGTVVDTRTPTVLATDEIRAVRALATAERSFVDNLAPLFEGSSVCVLGESADVISKLRATLGERFADLRASSSNRWQLFVAVDDQDSALRVIGFLIFWLMLNRGDSSCSIDLVRDGEKHTVLWFGSPVVTPR